MVKRLWHGYIFRKYSNNINISEILLLKYYNIFFFMNNLTEEIFFISRFNQTSLKETWKRKVFRLWNLLSFIVLASKLLLQKKSRVTFCENNGQKKRNVIIEILSCDFEESISWNFQNGSILSQDFTSNFSKWHEPKTGGYNFPNLTRIKLPKFSRT